MEHLVAVVDDDVQVCRAVGRLLRSTGFGVVTFTGGDQFLQFLESHCVDCVTLDLNMSPMSGFEVQQRLRGVRNRPPVVVLTANDSPELHRRAMDAGSSAFLRKPADRRELVEAVESAIGSAVGANAERTG